MKGVKKIRYYALPILSGVLVGTSYIPFPPWALFFCFTPLWFFALKQDKIRSLFVGGWLCQFVLTLIGFNWLIFTAHEFGGFSWPLSLIILLGFCAFANLQIPLSLLLWFWFKKIFYQKELVFDSQKKPLWVLLLLPLCLVLCWEYWPMVFDWHLGYAWFFAGFPASQTAELWGFSFLHTLTLFSALLVLLIIKNFSFKKLIILSTVWISSFLILNGLGAWLKKQEPEGDKQANILIVQPALANRAELERTLKRTPRAFLMNSLLKTTNKGLSAKLPNKEKIDFILWPESAYPYSIDFSRPGYQSQLINWIQKIKTPMVIPAVNIRNRKAANSVFVFDEKGRLISKPYDKQILMVFGEYLPGESILPLNKLLPYYGSSFERGEGAYSVQNLKGLKLGMQICYEGLFDHLTRKLAKGGAEILVNVTNDSWYGSWQEPYQHLYMTLARSIEVRRPLVRSTLTGFSSAVSAQGEILYISEMNKAITHLQKVSYNSSAEQTFFSQWGWMFNKIFVKLFLLFLFLFTTFIRKTSLKTY